MNHSKKRSRFLIILVLVIFLGSCNLPDETSGLEGKPGALYTEAAMTVSVQLTAAGIEFPQNTQITETPAPGGTPAAVPSSTFTIPTYTPEGAGEPTPEVCDQVKFIKDVTIPDEMDIAPGERFTKTWRLQNAGSCPWGIGYLLYFESGDILSGPSSKDLTSETIQPGESLDISVDLVAPEETGTYQGYWKLRNVKGEGFGVGEYSKAFWVKINVVEGAGMMLDFNVRADEAAWGSGSVPIDYADLGGKSLILTNREILMIRMSHSWTSNSWKEAESRGSCWRLILRVARESILSGVSPIIKLMGGTYYLVGLV